MRDVHAIEAYTWGYHQGHQQVEAEEVQLCPQHPHPQHPH